MGIVSNLLFFRFAPEETLFVFTYHSLEFTYFGRKTVLQLNGQGTYLPQQLRMCMYKIYIAELSIQRTLP